MSTIRTYLLKAAEENPNGVAFRWKQDGKWQTLTHRERLDQARTVAAMAASLGVQPGDRVALMMENRVEWTTVYLGLACSAITVVPVDAKLQPGEVAHILRDSGAVAIFAGGRRWPVLSEIESDLPDLHHVVLLDNAFADAETERHHDFARLFQSMASATVRGAASSPAVVEPPASAGVRGAASSPAVVEPPASAGVRGAASSPAVVAAFDSRVPTESTVASILYTSGTTGRPKGAMLTHGNFDAQIVGCLECFTVLRTDNLLLVLPLHHAFAFTANFLAALGAQCEITMVENLRAIPGNMKETHPTILLAVPLLAEKMLEAILKKLRKNLLASLLLKAGLGRVVGRQVIRSLGGKLRLLICGGAASDPEMLRMYNRFGIHTIEGYGLTETAPICALTPETELHLGTVGKAFPHCSLTIDAPNDEGIGEICVGGPILMKGYFHNDEATAETIYGGLLHTGDLGRLDANGYLTITGRKKSLIVNREGKNIYPEEVEQAINAAPHILESLVLGFHEGDEKAERVGVIFVPDMDRLAKEARGKSLPSHEQIEKLCTDELHKAIATIAEYKRPRKVQIRFEPFERTNTLKIKRYKYSLDED